MLITLYPNSELRVRIPSPPCAKHKGDSDVLGAGPPSLSIVSKLRSEIESPFKAAPVPPEFRPGYGGAPRPTAFGPRARRTIARSGGLIGQGDRRKNTLFLTGTIPGGMDEAFRALSDYSAWAIHELLTHLPRIGGVLASECQWIWVWEFQQRGALHFHCVFEAPCREAAFRIHEGFKRLWIRILESIGRKAGIDMAEREQGGTHAGNYKIWRTRSEWARKNPSRYLAKYCAKANRNIDSGRFFPPTRWYGISRKLITALKSETKQIDTAKIHTRPTFRIQELDVELLERCFEKSNGVTHFPDKFKDGYTFVFYFPEGEFFPSKLMEELAKMETPKTERTSAPSYYYLDRIKAHKAAYRDFLGINGEHANEQYIRYCDGFEIPDVEKFFLNRAAEIALSRQIALPRPQSGRNAKSKARVGAQQSALAGPECGKMEDGCPPSENQGPIQLTLNQGG